LGDFWPCDFGWIRVICSTWQGDWQEIEQALMGADFSILDRQAS
jgi:hypothetical protein